MSSAPPRPSDPTDRGRPAWLLPAAVVAAVVVAVGLWLTQPWLLFVDEVADEALPISAAELDAADGAADGAVDEMADGAADAPTADATADAEAADTDSGGEDRMGQEEGRPDGAVQSDEPSSGDESATDDAQVEPSAEASGSEEATATEPAAAPGPVVLARGEFISRDHQTSGVAAVVELEDGSRVLTIEDLDTDNGPDLYVYLDESSADAPEGEFDDGIDLGRLRANQGDLVYELPADLDLTGVASVAIWCDRFSSLFGAADLVPVG